MRRSALWGRRGGGFAWAAVTAAALALCAPLAALAGPGGGPHGKHAHVDPGLAQQAAANPNGDFRVIVQGQPGTNADTVSAAIGKAKADRHDTRGPGGEKKFKAISGVAATVTGSDIEALANDPNVDAITPDLPVANSTIGKGGPGGRGGASGRGGNGGADASKYSNDQVWADDAGVTPLWSQVDNAHLPSIAIVDSGVDPGPIARRLLTQVDLYSGSGQNSRFDGYGHGTMVAGIAALSLAHHAGAAPDANIVSLDVLDDEGTGTEGDVIAAVDWILQNKDAYNIRVANFSLATGTGTSILYDPLDKAVEKLWLAGVTVVTAAGNYGTPGAPSGVVTAPGNDPFVITVGAADTGSSTDPGDDFTAPWSAWGYTPDGFAKPELGAPGRMIDGPVPGRSTLTKMFPNRKSDRGYMWMSGTSLAAPIVSGIAADLLALHPDWTPDQVKGALMIAAQPYVDGSQFSLGVGIVDGAGAAEVAAPPNPNAALDGFVTTDAATGMPVFDSVSWADAAQADVSWSSVSWADVSWSSVSWSSVSWSSVSWSSAAWASVSWSSVSWADVSWSSVSWASAVNANAYPDS